MTVLRQGAYGQKFLYFTLAGAFRVGSAAYVAGYFLRPSATTEPFGLLADLLYTFGFALWTAAVVVVLVEIIPEASVGRLGVRSRPTKQGVATSRDSRTRRDR